MGRWDGKYTGCSGYGRSAEGSSVCFMEELHSGCRYRLYNTVLVSAFFLLLSSFFVKVDIGVRAYGILKPKAGRSVIRSSASGFVEMRKLSENVRVEKGDTLFVVKSALLDQGLEDLAKRKGELDAYIADLGELLEDGKPELSSGRYLSEYEYSSTKLSELELNMDAESRNYRRYRNLYSDRLVSLAEYEKAELDYRNAKVAVDVFKDSRKAVWEKELAGFVTERRSVEEKMERIYLNCSEAVSLAFSSGTVTGLAGVTDGQYVTYGTPVAEFSPDGELAAEAYVKTSDIAMIKEGQECRLMIDAFDSSVWGALDAVVTGISDDIAVLSDGTMVYKVYCSLSSQDIKGPDGSSYRLRKGMSFSSFFIRMRKSLFNVAAGGLEKVFNPYIREAGAYEKV